MRNRAITQTMWVLFAPTLKKHLPILGVSDSNAVMEKARKKYRAIIKVIPPFGKNDILILNLISATEIAAIYLSLDPKPSCEKMKEYYSTSMDDNRIMCIYLGSINYYSEKYQKSLAKQAEVSQLSDNPYSWPAPLPWPEPAKNEISADTHSQGRISFHCLQRLCHLDHCCFRL